MLEEAGETRVAVVVGGRPGRALRETTCPRGATTEARTNRRTLITGAGGAMNESHSSESKRSARRARVRSDRPRLEQASRGEHKCLRRPKLGQLCSRAPLILLQTLLALQTAHSAIHAPAVRRYAAVGPVAAARRMPLDDDFMPAAAVSIDKRPRRNNADADDDDDEPLRPAPSGEIPESGGGSAQPTTAEAHTEKFNQWLDGLPVHSVGQKHTAQFDCDVDDETLRRSSNFKLVWLKLVRSSTTLDNHHQQQPTPQRAGATSGGPADDTTLLSYNDRITTYDRRFKVQHQPPFRWTLSIENVSPTDDKAYFLCQVSRDRSSGGGPSAAPGPTPAGASYLGGGRLNVLAPPVIVENETSANLVLASEFEQLRLQCKVVSEPQSQISWRREDGRSLDGLEQRFRHHLDRRPHRVVSVDSAELLFAAVRRDQAGAYLCIAANGVQPGVSQRISLVVSNCRNSSEVGAPLEPCDSRSETLDQAEEEAEEEAATGEPSEVARPSTTASSGGITTTSSTTTTTTTTTTRRPPTGGWSAATSSSARRANPNNSMVVDGQPRGRTQHQAVSNHQTDKSRLWKYNESRRANSINGQRRRPPVEASNSNGQTNRGQSSSPTGWAVLVVITALVCIGQTGGQFELDFAGAFRGRSNKRRPVVVTVLSPV